MGIIKLMGPAFLVSVAYLDPGNWATAIEAGSRFGYKLIWVIALSNTIAILLQNLAARLGIVTGKHLAEVCREQYPTFVCFLLWVLCEISIVALDLTMVLGTAIGLNMVFHLPVFPCLILTSLDTVMVYFTAPKNGLRWSELVTAVLVGLVLLCFLVNVVISAPPLREVIEGLQPRLEWDSLYTAVALLGANVMPHNFYLHSALVKGRQQDGQSVDVICWYNFIDITCALGIALLINVGVLLVSASTFFSTGVTVETLQDGHDVVEQLLNRNVAPAVFGLALLIAGQLSTFTGTIAGQVVLEGFLDMKMRPWLRRLTTRSAAIVLAASLHHFYGNKGTYKMLVIAQVILALQLPFALIPLIKATSEKKLMGRHKNPIIIQWLSWGATSLIFLASLFLCISMVLPSEESTSGNHIAAGKINLQDISSDLFRTLEQMSHRPWKLLALVFTLTLASCILILLMWMVITPFSYGLVDQSLMPYFSKEWEWDLQNAQLKDNQMRLRTNGQTKILLGLQKHLHQNQETISTGPDSPLIPRPRLMTRGARRQFWSVLDNFWQEFFNLHGCPIGEHSESEKFTAIQACMKALEGIEGLNLMHEDPPWNTIDNCLERTLREEMHPIDVPVTESPAFLFGLWCLSRLLQLCQDESRPDLWGKYSLVLNRLQWLLPFLINEESTHSEAFEDVVRLLGNVESNVKSRKGMKGTGAGEIAFPKGKEIIVSVIRRYRRQLGVSQNKQKIRVSAVRALVAGAIFFGSAIICMTCVTVNRVME